ncbi:MAG TPA: 1-acyl-sn-glycerol-3-phosphate acyltransferase [Myxococcota bacterium]|nr:1-acyl-sn-glycerol-3-phosphate acyltransferase [Myxococcota bacterium]HRY97148.1 1-acyl-sn-glycerol-3-phosphate acyltransferase [Myxococcota bacterium]HSA21390.1 1-acyl-sn-glycerol-3-phosphate acyltransferase [Myxococcota bacterium]
MSPTTSAARRLSLLALYTLIFWLLLPGGLLALGAWLDRFLGLPPLGGLAAPGWSLVALGLGLMAWAMLGLWREGRGLPVSALPPPRLARRGPYRLVRHPIYLGFQLALLGAGLGLRSRALALIVAPAFLPLWLTYAGLEERGLVRRFGSAYLSYRRRAGLALPRLSTYRPIQALCGLRALPAHVEGGERVPAEGGAVLVANHACYLDPAFVLQVTRRPIRFLATAEMFRSPLRRWFFSRAGTIPLRRYRPGAAACRELLRSLEAGELVGMFPEGERCVLGALQGVLPEAARLLARLPWPILPVGISGSYDCGPRWADHLRRRPVRVRVGPPLVPDRARPAESLRAALAALLDDDPQPVHLDGLDAARLDRVLWRCPACLEETPFAPAALRCRACGARWAPDGAGGLRGADGKCQRLAELARPVWQAPERGPLRVLARGACEAEPSGPLRPLRPLGRDVLEVGPDGLAFGELRLRAAVIRTITTERADTLQVATLEGMWQFRPEVGSAFRLQLELERARADAGGSA